MTKRLSESPESESEPPLKRRRSARLQSMNPPSQKLANVDTSEPPSQSSDNHHEQEQSVLELISSIQRNIQCSICLEPMTATVAVQCGHTFCRSCLWNWFHRNETGDNRRRIRRVLCPSCRTIITQPPCAVFAVRALEDTLRKRLSAQENTASSNINGQDRNGNFVPDAGPSSSPSTSQNGIDNPTDLTENDNNNSNNDNNNSGPQRPSRPMPPTDDSDKTWGGIFPLANLTVDRGLIHDPSDNVHRCVMCNWEIRNGICTGCGLEADSDNDGSSPSANSIDTDVYQSEDEGEDEYESDFIDDEAAVAHGISGLHGANVSTIVYRIPDSEEDSSDDDDDNDEPLYNGAASIISEMEDSDLDINEEEYDQGEEDEEVNRYFEDGTDDLHRSDSDNSSAPSRYTADSVNESSSDNEQPSDPESDRFSPYEDGPRSESDNSDDNDTDDEL